jgi:hypothetical protein
LTYGDGNDGRDGAMAATGVDLTDNYPLLAGITFIICLRLLIVMNEQAAMPNKGHSAQQPMAVSCVNK